MSPVPTVDAVALADAVAAGVESLPGVARLGRGDGVEVATYYPGGKITGVSVGPSSVTVHVVAAELPVQGVVDEVRSLVIALATAYGGPRAVDVVVDDVEVDRLPAPEPKPGPDAGLDPDPGGHAAGQGTEKRRREDRGFEEVSAADEAVQPPAEPAAGPGPAGRGRPGGR